jgi:hypothetical protein
MEKATKTVKATKTAKTPKATKTTKTVAKKNNDIKATVENTIEAVTAETTENVNKVIATAQTVNSQITETATEILGDLKEMSLEIKDVVTEGVKEVAEKVDFTESVNKVKATAQNITETATEVMGDLKEMSLEIKDVVAESAKEVASKVDFKKTTDKVKKTAKNVNKQVTETATELVNDVKVKGQELQNTTTKLAKEAVENINVSDRVGKVKQVVLNANNYALETAEEVVEGLVANAEKWQALTQKTVNKGLELAEKQQNMVFETLEAIKGQVVATGDRFKKLFANN